MNMNNSMNDNKKENNNFQSVEKEENTLSEKENTSDEIKEIDLLKEEKIRLLADIENERKSHRNEIEQVVKYSNKKILIKIISLIDNYERALSFLKSSASTDDNKKNEMIFSGFHIIITDFKNSLKSEGVEEYFPVVEQDIWNSDYCEVIDEVENNNYPVGTVLEVFQKGYILHKRVIVTAKVSVSKNV